MTLSLFSYVTYPVNLRLVSHITHVTIRHFLILIVLLNEILYKPTTNEATPNKPDLFIFY